MKHPSVVMTEMLESRRLCDTVPAHLALARRSVAEIDPANNVYTNGTATVTWAGINGATLTTNASDCTTYVTHLLKQAYGFTSSQFIDWTGSSSPTLTKYYDTAVADDVFEGFTQISDLKVGDLFISKYVYAGATARGHMTIVDSPPVLVKINNGTQKVYNLTVIDCTGSVHASDTRNDDDVDPDTGAVVDDTGIGRGTMRVYTDMAGNLQTWSWGTSSSTTIYDPADRPCTFARVPPVITDASFDANSGPRVTVNFSSAVSPQTVTASDLSITNLTTNKTYAPISFAFSNNNSTITYALSPTLPDGNYRFKFNGSSATTVLNNAYNTSADLQGTGIFLLAGDANRDHTVNFSDLLILSQNYGQSGKNASQGDFNFDGTVNFNDLLLLSQKYGTTLSSTTSTATLNGTTSLSRVSSDVLV